jgi:hypothetical protein
MPPHENLDDYNMPVSVSETKLIITSHKKKVPFWGYMVSFVWVYFVHFSANLPQVVLWTICQAQVESHKVTNGHLHPVDFSWMDSNNKEILRGWNNLAQVNYRLLGWVPKVTVGLEKLEAVAYLVLPPHWLRVVRVVVLQGTDV